MRPSDEEQPDWTPVSRAIEKRQRDEALPLKPGEVPSALEQMGEGEVEIPTGPIGQYKAKKISQKAALEKIELWYQKQLEVGRKRLTEAVRVRSAEAEQQAEQFLRRINADHLEFIRDIDLRNERVRNAGLLELGDQTAETIQQVTQANWPPEMKEKMLADLFERFAKVSRKLLKELGE